MATKQEILESIGFASEEEFTADLAYNKTLTRINRVSARAATFIRDGLLSEKDIDNTVTELEKIVDKASSKN